MHQDPANTQRDAGQEGMLPGCCECMSNMSQKHGVIYVITLLLKPFLTVNIFNYMNLLHSHGYIKKRVNRPSYLKVFCESSPVFECQESCSPISSAV